uniref:FHA domain-containing protein n=1 Tax=Homalodisca liturata TaxID=320908 RepID=A0A1B6I298_9HEMI
MENCTQVLDDSVFLNYETPDIGRLRVGTLLIQGVLHDIFRGDNIIGRDELSDIVIRSGAISSKHAVIEVEDWDTHLVYDCGSTNKTRLAKAVLKPNVRYNLQGDDDLMFADLKAKYTKLEKPQDPNDDDNGSETGSESMLNCDSVNQALDLDTNDPEPGPSSRVEKPQDLNDDDSGSETGSESMLNCESINQALDLDVNDSEPGPSSRRTFGGEESGHISESVLDDSSVLEHKNKDIEESHIQVIDASGDETEDDEFFVLPSQTVKEFESNRKDKSNKMADLSLTEDIFDPFVVAKHYKNKDYSTSKLEINSSKDIFEVETQGDDFDSVCKPSVGVSEDRNLMDIDTECVFNTEAQLPVKDRNNQCDTSIFEAETQEMGLSQMQIQKAEKSCDIDIFHAESELAECHSELHNKNKEFESSGKENVTNEDKLNDINTR